MNSRLTPHTPVDRTRVAWSFGGLIAGMALLLALIGCAVNPATGKRELSLMSTDQEVQIGHDGYPAVVAEYGLYDDPRLAAYVDSLGHKLAAVSHLPTLDWHFTLLDDPTVNAFAMPGGYIYITRGIMAHLGSEAQLAGVIGHEIGHVTARHAAKQMTQQQLAGVGLGVAGLFSTTVRQYGQVAQQALGLMMLKYSRDDETQADQLGVDYATKAGYDPREIPKTYEMLARVGAHAGQRLPSFLSTHPDPGDRQVRTAALAQAAVAGKRGLIIREREYLHRLDGVVFGNDPRQGYVSGEMFYQPAAGYEARLPAGWPQQVGHASVVAAKSDQTAGMQLAMSPKANGESPEAMVSSLLASGKLTAANGHAETLGGYSAWVGTVVVPAEKGPARLAVGLVRINAGSMLQATGSSAAGGDADEQAILASIRSIRPIADAGKKSPSINRVQVSRVARAGSFESVVNSFGPLAVDVDQISILNNRDAGENVLAGELVKVVKLMPR